MLLWQQEWGRMNLKIIGPLLFWVINCEYCWMADVWHCFGFSFFLYPTWSSKHMRQSGLLTSLGRFGDILFWLCWILCRLTENRMMNDLVYSILQSALFLLWCCIDNPFSCSANITSIQNINLPLLAIVTYCAVEFLLTWTTRPYCLWILYNLIRAVVSCIE